MEGLSAIETAFISTTEGMTYVMEINGIYVKALQDAAEMLSAAIGVDKDAAKMMILGDSYFQLERIANGLAAVREVLNDAVKEIK